MDVNSPSTLPPPPPPSSAVKMAVEVKLRLANSAAHKQLSEALAPFHIKTKLQENMYFDGPNSELSSNHVVLCLRFYEEDSLAAVILKANAVLSNGISRLEEDFEEIKDVDPAVFRACVAHPWRLFTVKNSRILKRIKDEFGVDRFVCLGGFRNVRAYYDWKGLKLDLDETQYDFGTRYEIECECSHPEGVKKVLEEFLRDKGIQYSNTEVSKLTTFRSGKLLW